jgi:anti-anti-sigma factor
MLSKVPGRDASGSDPGAPIRIAVEMLADGTPLVSVWGEVDLATAPRLAIVLEEAAAGDRDVHVEFSQDSFIDSTGLGVLIKIAQQLRACGRTLRVTTDNPHTRGVIEATGLADTLGLYTTARPGSVTVPR